MNKTSNLLKMYLALSLSAFVMSFGIIFELNSIKNENLEKIANSYYKTISAVLLNDKITKEMKTNFINKIVHDHEIEDVWVSNDSIVDSFKKIDEIDKEVLKSEKKVYITDNHILDDSFYRATYFLKEAQNKMGTLSIVLNANLQRNHIIVSTLKLFSMAVFIAIIMMMLVNKTLKPYNKFIQRLDKIILKASNGDYSDRMEKVNVFDNVTKDINTFLDKLENMVLDIEHKIHIFMTEKKVEKHADHLLSINKSLNHLSDLYNFRMTIEHDETISEVYSRLAFVLENKFDVKNFNFIECNTITGDTKIVYTSKEVFCTAEEHGCRADRTNVEVYSKQFSSLCDRLLDDKLEYLCIPYSVSNEMDLVLNIVEKSSDKIQEFKKARPYIDDYFSTVKPEVVSKKLMQTLTLSARQDPLTSLFNRKYLEEAIETITSQALRTDLSYGVLMIDIDFFKMVNDEYGHDVGDVAIKILADTLVECTRESDMCIRYGGEEFIVLLHNCDTKKVSEVSEKLRLAFKEKKIRAGNKNFSKTISIGASIFPNDSKSFWNCIKYSDIALYKAKHSGRDKVIVFSEELLENEDMSEGSF